ncbi:MAG: hypothetical protein DSY47_02400 [Hydrogenothermus sp.]|nr:MAG: hypothetical protein DSY47_02400 [Hydrogenothermus sp.]
MFKCFLLFVMLTFFLILFIAYKKVKLYINPISLQKEKVYVDYYVKDLPLKEISLITKDNITIKGWFAENNSKNAVILVHGIVENRSFMNRLTKFYFENGFSVLAIDLRNHGKSEKTKTTLGYNERLDVLSAVKFLKEKNFKKIIIHAVSMGAVASILAKNENPNDIDFIIADSPYISLKESALYTYKIFSKPLANIFANITLFLGEKLTGIKISRLNIRPLIKKYHKDMLLIFCEFDLFLDTKKAYEEFKSFNTVFFENTIHAMAFVWYPEKYFQILRRVLSKYD